MANTYRDWIPDSTEAPKNVFADFIPEQKPQLKEELKEEAPTIYKCDVCGFVAAARLGLISHKRKHATK